MLDTQKIRQIVSEVPEARPYMDYLVARERHRGEFMSLNRVVNKLNKQGSAIDLKTVEEACRRLQEAGAGIVIERNKRRYFKWDINITRIGQLIRGQVNPVSVKESAFQGPIEVMIGHVTVKLGSVDEAAALIKLVNTK